jgi:tetratricopeptide (TPR) repeat protein
LDEALALANQGVRLDPEFPHLRDTRGAILARMPGRLRDARRDFEMCVQLTQRDQPRLEAPAQLSLARVCIQLEDREAARRALDAAARLDAEIGAFNDSEKADLAELRKQVGDG